jgi:signal transduction histidine kinase/ActR/RegA family two-component response regulator
MSTRPSALRAESYRTVGSVIQRDTGVILQRWTERAKADQPTARRVHHDVLLDHLPTFLWELGRSLVEEGDPSPSRHARSAEVHGDQRWVTGWSISELVRDYQLLRLVLVEYLEEALDRPLTSREVMALGVAVDDAIEASVSAYAACQAEAAAGGDEKATQPPAATAEGVYNVLAFLGHELRNPLAPLGNAIHILRIVSGDPEQVETTLELMQRQFRHLTRLVDDLLDVPRLAQGKLSLKRERLDLAGVVRTCAEDRKAAMAEAGLRLVLDLPDGPVWTTGDATRLCQAVNNLLGNAQKFTDRGGEVWVGVKADPGRHLAELTVRDTGIGIEPSFLPKVFETFIQAERSLDRSRGGLGLGLALVKGVVELHGGTVRALSEGPGMGAEFVIELPLLSVDFPPDAAQAGRSADPGGPRRVLVIEDNHDSADSLRLFLELVGHRVTVCHGGPEGLEAAQSLDPEVIICDIGLPGMSGYAVCGELRKNARFRGTLLVALSGHGSGGSQESALAAGFDLFFLKPVDPELLAQAIGDRAPRPGQSGVDASAPQDV